MSHPPFVEHCIELLAPLGAVRARRMFGGWGLYVDECFIALIAADRLYLKTDDTTRPRFEVAGCEPFSYEARGERKTMAYFAAPDDALDSPALMLPWARMALQAALSARAAAPTARRVRPRATADQPAGPAATSGAQAGGRRRSSR